VAFLLPARGLAARAPGKERLNGLADYARAKVAGEEPAPPERIALEEPITVGGEQVGVVLLLSDEQGEEGKEGATPLLDRADVLHAAAVAVLAEVADAGAREEAEARLRGSLIEDLRAGGLPPAEVTQRAGKLGCDLVRGAVGLAAELRSSRPSHAAALVEGSYDGAVAQLIEGRLYAILPARGGDERTVEGIGGGASRTRCDSLFTSSRFGKSPSGLPGRGRSARPEF
jgi:hypothetical protein